MIKIRTGDSCTTCATAWEMLQKLQTSELWQDSVVVVRDDCDWWFTAISPAEAKDIREDIDFVLNDKVWPRPLAEVKTTPTFVGKEAHNYVVYWKGLPLGFALPRFRYLAVEPLVWPALNQHSAFTSADDGDIVRSLLEHAEAVAAVVVNGKHVSYRDWDMDMIPDTKAIYYDGFTFPYSWRTL